MKKIIVALLLLTSTLIFGQQKRSKEEKNVEVEVRINQAEFKLYLVGGIASPITKEVLRYGEKYSIAFHDFGCTPPMPIEKYEHHNLMVFEMLSRRYGYRWEKELPITVIGLNKWKIQN